MISRRQIISVSAGPIFATFSHLGVDNWSGPLFPISQGRLPWQPICGKNGAKLPTPCTYYNCHSETEWDIALRICAFIAPLIALHRVKMVKIGSVVFELKWVRKWKFCCNLAEIGLYRKMSQQQYWTSLYQRFTVGRCRPQSYDV